MTVIKTVAFSFAVLALVGCDDRMGRGMSDDQRGYGTGPAGGYSSGTVGPQSQHQIREMRERCAHGDARACDALNHIE